MTITARYDYILRNMNERQARAALAGVNNAGFQDFLTMLDDIGAIIGADAVFTNAQALAEPRFGSTIVIPERARPLSWLNLRKHRTIEELVDTVVHEAVHATVRVLKRHQRTPEPEELIAYHGEEIVAMAATNLILRKIEFPAYHQIARNMITIDECKNKLSRLGCNAQFLRERFAEAAAAEAFFTDSFLEFGAPTAVEVRTRRSSQ
ncbi:hypothetical protein [Bradyrhizobium sp. BR 1432]|uniref:hypothetical protein n=1 Tax=Bradyrhizobium sp. BR 1432 TaxID=3447966 RepID=UPI003EE4813B